MLKELDNEACFLKAGFFGFEAAGKTTSAVLLAIGLHQFIKSTKPIGFWDSETGSDFTKHYFDHAKIKLLREKARSLKSLSETIQDASKKCDILIIDSLTHPYKELTKAYRRKKKKGGWFISIQDWQPIKETWQTHFADPYVNLPLHIIWCARAKNLFDEIVEQGFNGEEYSKTVQTGVGVRSETESSFEPSLQVEFERIYDKENPSAKYYRQATVVKDRFGILDGESKRFITYRKNGGLDYKKLIDNNPTFEFFKPHISRLNLGGKHIGFNQDSSETLFDGSEKDFAERAKRTRIALENIENGLTAIYTSGEHKANKLAIIFTLFDTRSWESVKTRDLYDLEIGVKVINKLKEEMQKGFDPDENTLVEKTIKLRNKTIMEDKEQEPLPLGDEDAKLPLGDEDAKLEQK